MVSTACVRKQIPPVPDLSRLFQHSTLHPCRQISNKQVVSWRVEELRTDQQYAVSHFLNPAEMSWSSLDFALFHPSCMLFWTMSCQCLDCCTNTGWMHSVLFVWDTQWMYIAYKLLARHLQNCVYVMCRLALSSVPLAPFSLPNFCRSTPWGYETEEPVAPVCGCHVSNFDISIFFLYTFELILITRLYFSVRPGDLGLQQCCLYMERWRK